jgi:hypothetical protein
MSDHDIDAPVHGAHAAPAAPRGGIGAEMERQAGATARRWALFLLLSAMAADACTLALNLPESLRGPLVSVTPVIGRGDAVFVSARSQAPFTLYVTMGPDDDMPSKPRCRFTPVELARRGSGHMFDARFEASCARTTMPSFGSEVRVVLRGGMTPVEVYR